MKRLALVMALAFVLTSTLAFAGEWTGTIVKENGKLALKSGANLLTISNPDKVAGQEGKSVKVTGTADMAAKTVTVASVSAA